MNHSIAQEPAVTVIGAGLAGSECAYQLARRGVRVRLWEMRPKRTTPAHQGPDFAELVCSNSLRSDDPEHAAGLLKREMERFDSLIIGAAREAAVPAGGALAVDRSIFAKRVTEVLEQLPNLEIVRDEMTELPSGPAVIATGPLTSEALSQGLMELLGEESLYFYDAIAPIVEAESLDYDKLFAGSRYGKGQGDDYLNAPLDEQQYQTFYDALISAQVLELRAFEKDLFFEGCLPIEEIARRGVDTLRFGPMKPVGLTPPSGKRAHAIVQLRQEDLAKSQYNLVGFQSRMTWGEQKRVLRLIPGLEGARFVRLGQIHRNTFVNSPRHLDELYRLRCREQLRLAGQLTGVEGYLESAATGLLVALYIVCEQRTGGATPLPQTTALGALARHLTQSDAKRFQPANINYGLFEPLQQRLKKRDRRAAYVARAGDALQRWIASSPLADDSAADTASSPNDDAATFVEPEAPAATGASLRK